MSISEPFIRKPVATTLLVVAITLAGAAAYRLLPVSPLPQVEFPTISVSASLPGASPATMASSVATPLEDVYKRQLPGAASAPFPGTFPPCHAVRTAQAHLVRLVL